ncbi:MAG TPA: YetF domain-containing protein [Chloroflexota bacterium]|jgi:uncharacterized membrane protein YcaP (DUF421 family)
MSDSPLTLVGIVAQTLVIYLCLIVGLRLIGRREMAELSLLDYLIVALLGSAVETGLYGGSASLEAGLVSMATLLLANRALTWLVSAVPPLRRLLMGTPVVLVHDGQIVFPNLRRQCLTRDDVMQGIRRRGYDRLEDVRFAVLEADGRIAVIPREEPQEEID